MRNPNSYGAVLKLSGKRRKPWAVRITTGWEYSDNGKAKQIRKYLGYYETRKEAMNALADYNVNPYDIDARSVTFGEIVQKWYAKKKPELKPQSITQYELGIKNVSSLNDRLMTSIRTEDIEDILNALAENYSATIVNSALMVARNAFQYAIQHGVVSMDYSQYVKKPKMETKSEMHKPFTIEEVRKIWDLRNQNFESKKFGVIYPARLVLIMLYTGMRIGELLDLKNANTHIDEHYMIGGLKTKAGIDRAIPIHDKIYDFIKDMASDSTYLTGVDSEKMKIFFFRTYIWNPLMHQIGAEHLPHDCRHTFISQAKKCNADTFYIQRIVGHANESITEKIYTHADISKLLEVINAIDY